MAHRRQGPEEVAPARPVLPASVTITLEGVVVAWPDGSESVARPPGHAP